MINKIKTSVLMMMSLALLSSCATIMHGPRQAIGISSHPTDASVWVDTMFVGNTPIFVDLTRKDNHIVRIELEGFQPYEVIFSKKLSEWVLGNVIFGGIIGLAVDAVTGSIYSLTPDQIQAELHSYEVIDSKRSDDSFIAIVLQADPSWKKVGNLVASQ